MGRLRSSESNRIAVWLRRFAHNRCRRMIDPGTIGVRTYCRICGDIVNLEVIDNYEIATRYLMALDDAPMLHRGIHEENGGWGVSWRFDEVLAAAFPHEHLEEIWPIPVWWWEMYGEPESEEDKVLLLDSREFRSLRDREIDFSVDYDVFLSESGMR